MTRLLSILFGVCCLLFVVFPWCLVFGVLPRSVNAQPPLPGGKIYKSGEVAKGATLLLAKSAVVQPPWLNLYWGCACGQPMPHDGHEFDIESYSSFWSLVQRTNQPPVKVPPGLYRVGCHLGNWPPP